MHRSIKRALEGCSIVRIHVNPLMGEKHKQQEKAVSESLIKSSHDTIIMRALVQSFHDHKQSDIVLEVVSTP